MVNQSTGSPAPTYSWSVLPATAISSPTAANPVISFSNAASYTVTLSATNGTNTSVSVNVIQTAVCVAAVANFSVSAAACKNAATTVTNSSTGTPSPTYTWSTMPGALISNPSATNPTITFTVNGTYTVFLTASAGGSVSTTNHTLSVSVCVGISESSLFNQSIGLYPNPASEKINIEVANVTSYNYQITDLLGKVIVSDAIHNKEKATVDVSNINKGIYFLIIESNGQKATKKIIVE